MLKVVSGILFPILFWLVIFESLGYVFFSNAAQPFDEIKLFLAADQKYGWLQKANKSFEFLGTHIQTDELGFRNSKKSADKGAKKVLLLGPSSAFGWGVNAGDTYAEVLSQFLQKHWGSSVHVYNASVIGFSSEQGRRVYEDLFINQQFDLVLIAYGVNDLDRHRFFFDDPRTDREFFKEPISSSQVRFTNVVGKSFFASSIVLLMRNWVSTVGCPSLANFNKVRVVKERAIENIISIARSEAMKNTRVVLLDTPYLLKDDGLGSNIDLYQKAALESEKRNCKSARELLLRAKSAERGRISRELGEWSRVLNDAAKRDGLSFIALHGFLESSDFVDPVHPNGSGHHKIAELIFENIKD